MDDAKAWHQETIDRSMGQTLRELCERRIAPRFYLAGGTALALQLGHRRSVDLDFFSPEHFEAETLVQKLQVMPEFSLASLSESTVHTTTGKTKVSFFGYVYPVLFPFKTFLGASLADPRDIACMKINAMARRGTKRDFVDVFIQAALDWQRSPTRTNSWGRTCVANDHDVESHLDTIDNLPPLLDAFFGLHGDSGSG